MEVNNGRQKIGCGELADLIREGHFDYIHIILSVANVGFAPIMFTIAGWDPDDLDAEKEFEYVADILDLATEGDRYMEVDIRDECLYLECGQHPPTPARLHPYVNVCPRCYERTMDIDDFRQGQGDDEQSWYTCSSCGTEVYINVTTFDDDEEE